jgi:hypothetical protein
MVRDEDVKAIDTERVGRIQEAFDSYGEKLAYDDKWMVAGLIGLTINRPNFTADGETVFNLPLSLDLEPDDDPMTCYELAYMLTRDPFRFVLPAKKGWNFISFDPRHQNHRKSPRVALAELLQAGESEDRVYEYRRRAGNDFVISLLRMGLLKQWYDNNSTETDGIYAGLYHGVKVIVLNALTGIQTGLYPDSIEEIRRLKEEGSVVIMDDELRDFII